jgi:hypothetical protein
MSDRKHGRGRPELDTNETDVTRALRAAWQPTQVDPSLHARLLARALEDPLAPATASEQADAGQLRDALQDGSPHEAAELARALRSAWQPAALDARVHRTLVARAVRPRHNVVFVAFGAAAGVVAIAASVLLVVRTAVPERAITRSTTGDVLTRSRSTAPLFADKFRVEDTTRRIEQIAAVREQELRRNRFATWGVR